MNDDPHGEASRINEIVDDLVTQAENAGLRAGLPAGSGEEVRGETLSRLLKRAEREPGFFAAMSDTELQSYVSQSIKNIAVDIARRERWNKRVAGRLEDLAPNSIDDTKALQVGFARDMIGRIRAVLPKEGLFAINCYASGEDPSSRALRHGVSARTGRRWCVNGGALVAAAVHDALYGQLGDDCLKHFLELCRWTRELRSDATGLLPGALSYRARLGLLSRDARRVVFFFEEGEPLDEVIDDIAWRDAPPGCKVLTEADRHGARKALLGLIKEIRVAFSE